MEMRRCGQAKRWRTLLIRALSIAPPSYPSSSFLFSSSSSSFPPSIYKSSVSPARSNEDTGMLNRSYSLLLALLFLPILLSLSLYLFLLEVVWNFSPSSVQSFLSAQGHLCLSARPQWGLFVASCWSLPLLPSVEKCVLGRMHVCASSPYFFRLSSVIRGPPFAFWPGRHPSGWLWNEAKT